MATITATSSGNYDDCFIIGLGSASSSWSDTRNVTTGNYNDGISTSNVGNGSNNVGSFKTCYRTFFSFDLSGEDAGTITSATIKFYQSGDATGFSTRTAQTDEYLHLCKATPAGSDFVAADFNNLDGWVSSGTYEGNVTQYAEKISQSGSAGWNTFNLNATALSDINSELASGTIEVALLTSEDFTDNLENPYSGGFFGIHGVLIWMAESASKPTLEITYGAAATDNAVFFGCNF